MTLSESASDILQTSWTSILQIQEQFELRTVDPIRKSHSMQQTVHQACLVFAYDEKGVSWLGRQQRLQMCAADVRRWG